MWHPCRQEQAFLRPLQVMFSLIQSNLYSFMSDISATGILRNLSFENDACRAEIAAQRGIEALLEV